MADRNRIKLYWTTFLTGVLSISSYVLLFANQEWVTRHFTRGGWYALLPIATAFYFSFTHGAFTSNVLHLVGFRVRSRPAADAELSARRPS